MDISKFLSKALGIYLILISFAIYLNINQFDTMVNHLVSNAPLMFVTGCFTLILGILMVVSHNVWEWSWRLIITIFAWLIFFKGSVIVLCPHALDKATLLFTDNLSMGYVDAGIGLILGIILCYFGFRRQA